MRRVENIYYGPKDAAFRLSGVYITRCWRYWVEGYDEFALFNVGTNYGREDSRCVSSGLWMRPSCHTRSKAWLMPRRTAGQYSLFPRAISISATTRWTCSTIECFLRNPIWSLETRSFSSWRKLVCWEIVSRIILTLLVRESCMESVSRVVSLVLFKTPPSPWEVLLTFNTSICMIIM